MSQKSLTQQLTPMSAPVETLLLICEKCGAKKSVEDHENPSVSLQKRLKMRIREVLKPGEGRAVLTSCLSICPENAITIGFIDPAKYNATMQFHVLHEGNLEEATDLLFQQFFLKRLK